MLRLTLGLAASVVLAASAPALAAPADPAPAIAAERAFAARAAVAGVAASFLEYMTDDAIVFSPDPVNAKALYATRPAKAPKDGGTLLAWWPNFAGMAASGDLGFTTGPATINGGKPAVFYFTVWARQPDGGWKWIFDGGIEAEGAKAPGPEATVTLLAPAAPAAIPQAEAMNQVRLAESHLAAGAKADSVAAYRRVLARDARVQGSKLGPAATPPQVAAELATRATSIEFAPLGGRASRAGDLVWTYGDARWDGGRGHYVRIWQRGVGGWKIVFDQIVSV